MAGIHDHGPGLQLVDLDLPLEGFGSFISSWLYRRNGSTLLVDPGPRATYPALRQALFTLGVERIDAVALTHIHIDHAGSAGLLARDFGDAVFVCHPLGFAHLVDPERLWSQSRKVLGPVAECYGPIEVLPRDRLTFAEKIAVGRLSVGVVESPGHAPHHVSYTVDGLLFAGEALGTFTQLADGGTYLRPATPPVFERDVYLSSCARLASIPAERVCFAHYGSIATENWDWKRPVDQLELWLEHLKASRAPKAPADDDAVFEELLSIDPALARFASLPEAAQKRERFFARNSIRGLRLYLDRQRHGPEGSRDQE